MVFEDRCHVGLFLYASLGTFLFFYALPFIYVGFSPYYDMPLAYNPTVLCDPEQNRQEYPKPTRVALWFAEQRCMRLLISVFIVASLTALHLIRIGTIWKRRLCHYVLWLNMAVFLVSYIGLVFYLVL